MALLPSIATPHHFHPLPPETDSAATELARHGACLDVDFVLRFFPVYDFQRQAVAALFCTPMCAVPGVEAIYGHKAFHSLAPEEWAAVDVAILEHALAFNRRMASAGIVVGVGASVSFATLNDPQGRILYREALRGISPGELATFVIKIEDIPDNTPGKRIGEIVSSLKGLAPRIWVHLPGSQMPLIGTESLHANGVVLSMPARLPLHGMTTEARWLAKVAQMQTALACMDHVDTANELETVRAEKIRFVAGGALHRHALAGAASLDEVRDALYSGPAESV